MDELDQIRQRINIVDLISESVQLKKMGRNFKALCPFHNERTPSFVVSPERQIWHCFGCFPPGEKIKTPFGYHKIENIDTNHWVVSGKGNIKKVVRTMRRYYEGDLVSITPRKLRFTTRLTADHNIYTIAGAPYTQKKYKDFSKRYRKLLRLDRKTYQKKINRYFPIREVPASNLKRGNLLLYPIQKNVSDTFEIDLSQYISKTTRLGPVPKEILYKLPISHELLTYIGYYIAEGSSHRAYVRFSLGNHEEDLARQIVNLGKKLFGIEAKIHRRSGKKTGIEVTLCHSKLANIFENLCGKGAKNKHIPFIFQELSAVKQKIIVDAIHRGDGTTFQVNRSQKTQKSIITISLTLAEQLVDILLRCNFYPSLHIGKTHIDKNNVHHREWYSVFWSEQDAQRYNLIYHKEDGSQYWILPIDEVKSEKYSGSVYNLTIADDHSYVTSSFAVSNCGKGGDIFTFLMELDRLEFPEALKILANKAGVKLISRASEGGQAKIKDALLEMHHLSAEYYHYILTSHKIGERARLYLKERGMTDKLIRTFQLGFAPTSWDNLTRYLQKKGFRDADIEKSGLAIRGRSGFYDRFRARIMFPLKNYRGATIAFAGRLLEKEAKEAKYVNSPETLLYTKGETLYGLDVTKEAIRKSASVVVVEGEFDAISSFAAGVANVVAIKGSALTEAHVTLLKRFTERMVLALDADTAGDAAARRGIEIADRAGVEVRVAPISSGKDPDEAARENPALWKKSISDSIPFYDFLISSALKRYDVREAFGKKKITDEVLPVLSRLTNPIVQAHYLKLLSEKLDVNEDRITEALRRVKIIPSGTHAVVQEAVDKPHGILIEEHLLSQIIQAPDIKKVLHQVSEALDPSDFTDPLVKRIFMELIDYAETVDKIEINIFSRLLQPELVATVDRLYLVDLTGFASPEADAKELEHTIHLVKQMILRRKIKHLTTQIKHAENDRKEAELAQYSQELTQLSGQLKDLEKAI